MSKLGSTKKQLMRQEIGKAQELRAMYNWEQRKDRLFRNGITIDDLTAAADKAAQEAYKVGKVDAEKFVLKAVYSAVVLTLLDRGTTDRDEIIEFVKLVDSKVLYAISEIDLIDKVLDSTGIELRFNDPIERIVEK